MPTVRTALTVAAVAALTAGTWAVAARTESNAQLEARATPAATIPVTAPVTTGQLTPAVSINATADHEHRATAARTTTETETVTAITVNVGDTIAAGTVLFRANSRPVLALTGTFPLYRDLHGGDTGDDVTALQQALAAAGHPTGRDTPGTYGPGTKQALTALYRAAGHTPPDNDPAIRTQIAALQQQPATDPNITTQIQQLTRQLGPIARPSELASFPTLPGTVTAAPTLGPHAEAATVTIGTGTTVLTATIPSSTTPPLTIGTTATFPPHTDTPTEPHDAPTATLTAISPNADDTTTLTFTTTTPPPPGTTTTLTIANPANEPDDRLLVPTAALINRNGRRYLYRATGTRFEQLEVVVTGTAGGTSAVTHPPPANTKQRPLTDGDQVRVGIN
jgi:hypothetical protein